MLNVDKVEEYRKRSGYTITQLVEQLGITDTTYNNLKKSRDFRITQIEKMANLFGVDIAMFFDSDDKEVEERQNNYRKKTQNNYSSESQNNYSNEPEMGYNSNENVFFLKIIIEKLDRLINAVEKKDI